MWVLVLGSMKCGHPWERGFLCGAGGAVLEMMVLLLGGVDGYGVDCICKLESHLWLIIFFCFVSSVLLLDFLICQCIYRITGFCNILSSFFFFLFLFWWVGGSAVAYPSVSWMAGPAADSHLFCFCFIL